MVDTILEETTKRVKFPAAAILLLVSAFSGLIQFVSTLYRLLPVISRQPAVLTSQISTFLRLLLVVFLAVVLLQKKRSGLLLGALSALWVWTTVLCLTPLLAGRTNLMLLSAVFSLLSTAAAVVAILFSAKLLLHESDSMTDRFRKRWFLPAILLTVAGAYGFFQTVILGYPSYLLLFSMFSVLFNGITYFLLFRWLAYPYAQTAAPVGQTAFHGPASQIPVNTVSDCADSVSPVSAATFAFCPACGAKLIENAAFCPSCGNRIDASSVACSQGVGNLQTGSNPADAPSGGFAALGFFAPVVGLILYLVWKDSLPLRAKSAGKGALAGAITWTALTVLLYAIYFLWMGSLFAGLF